MPVGHVGAHVFRQFQEPQKIRDRRAVFADGGRDLVLRETEFIGQAPIRLRFVDRVEILALDVFDERHLEQRPLLSGDDFADDDRDAVEARFLRGAPAALAGDDVKAIAASPHDNRLNDAV